MPYDVAFFEAFSEEQDALRRFLPTGIEAYFAETSIQEMVLDGPPAPILSVRTQSKIPPSWSEDLEAIITRSTGYDHILAFRRKAGFDLPAAYFPLYCHRAVAEHALLLWMSLLRKLPSQLSAFARFERNSLTGYEAQGRQMAVFGVGHIGAEIADIGRGLRMRVMGVDVQPTALHIPLVSKNEALAEADILVCAMNLTDENSAYFDDESWASVKPGAIFVNVGRGELAPLGPLRRALEAGNLAGVGLDVFAEESNLAAFLRGDDFVETEEITEFRRLRDNPQVMMTPHNAFNTHESVERKAQQTVDQLQHWREHGAFSTPVL